MWLLLLVGAVSVPKHGAVSAHTAKNEAGVTHAQAPEPPKAASAPSAHENKAASHADAAPAQPAKATAHEPAKATPHAHETEAHATAAPAHEPAKATATHAHETEAHATAAPAHEPAKATATHAHETEAHATAPAPVGQPAPVAESKAKPELKTAHPRPQAALLVQHEKAVARSAESAQEHAAAQAEHLTKADAARLEHEKDAALAALTEHIAREELQQYEAASQKPNASEAAASSGAFLSRFEFPVKPRPVFFAGDGQQDQGWTSSWALFEEMPLLFVLPGAAVICILALLAALVRYLLTGGLELHWSAQLTSRTDWSKLSDGDFVKVVGHVSAINKAQELISPLAGTKCVAYSVSVAFDKGGVWHPYTSHARVTSFTVLDDNQSALLISEKESYMYNLSTVKEWTYSTKTCPDQFRELLQKKGDASSSLPPMRLRFREEVLELGAKVSCVGAVSTQRASLPTESVCLSSVGSLRPAYATLMFRDERIPWAKMTELGTDDWAKLAASVLVSGYRPGR